jgi:hypothetical protein
MNTHPQTLLYIAKILKRPEMFIRDLDVFQIETLLHGFEAGLASVGALTKSDLFNREFTNFVASDAGLSGSLGWARALVDRYGRGKPSYDAFRKILGNALPKEFAHAQGG